MGKTEFNYVPEEVIGKCFGCYFSVQGGCKMTPKQYDELGDCKNIIFKKKEDAFYKRCEHLTTKPMKNTKKKFINTN
jgi:hypothetical protein